MYGIADDIDKLLGKKEFWYWVIGLNLACLLFMMQPLALVITIAGLILLLTVRGILRSFQRGLVWALCKFLLKAFCTLLLFAMTAGLIGLCFGSSAGSPGQDSASVAAMVLSGIIWGAVAVWWVIRRHRKQRTEEAVLRRRSEEFTRAQAGSHRMATAEQRRRENARSSCELLYALHAADIGQRYPRVEFDAFVKKYMSDTHEPEYVEDRAEKLKAIIEQQRQKTESPTQRMSLQDLAHWYEATRLEIDGSPLPSRQKDVQLAQLNQRYQTLVQEAIEEMSPQPSP